MWYFDDLAGYLSGLGNRKQFHNRLFKIGPLSINLSIAQDIEDMEFGAALPPADLISNSELNESTRDSSRQTSFVVYVLWSSKCNLEKLFPQFYSCIQSKTLQQLSDPDHTQQFFVRNDQNKILKVFDQKNGFGLLAFEDRDLLPSWELFSPIKEFIHLHALNQSCLLMHAATIVAPDRLDAGTLVVGPGGSGKSTLTAYAVEQGMLTNGDDYVLVDLRHDKPQCWSVYRTLKLHPSSPVLHGNQSWRVWRKDELSGKSVILAAAANQGGPITGKVKLNRVCGLSLQKSPEIYNPKAGSSPSDPQQNPYIHICMSTIQQIPYRMDLSLALSKKLHQAIPYTAHSIAPGMQGLKQAFDEIIGRA